MNKSDGDELFKDLTRDYIKKLHKYDLDNKRSINIDLADSGMEVVVWVRTKQNINGSFGYKKKGKK